MFPLLRSFYKHVLGMPVDYYDIEAIEPDYFKSLKQLLEYPLEALGVELTFSSENLSFGRVQVYVNTTMLIYMYLYHLCACRLWI